MATAGFPDFFIIGAMKSGTSSLHHYLASHAEICMSVPKEPNYFSKRRFFFHKSPGWYRSLFGDQRLLKGESSTAYSKYPTIKHVPERICASVPHAKFIYLLRDPVERTISHVTHDILEGFLRPEPTIDPYVRDFEKSIYLQYSRYLLQLRQYERVFPPDRLLLLSAEALHKAPRAVLSRVCAFLDVGDHFGDQPLQERWNVTRDRMRITDRANFKAAKKHGDAAKAKRWLEPFSKPSISPSVRRDLESYLRQERELVESVTADIV